MKMRRGLLLGLVIVAALLATLACTFTGAGRLIENGSGRVVEETREIEGVRRVELATVGNLYIEIGDEESLTIEAEDNLIEYIETAVWDGKLTIDIRRNFGFRSVRPINYRLVVTELEGIELSSSGDGYAPDLTAGDFEVRLSSSGDLEMGDLTADSLTIRVTSSGDLRVDDVNVREVDATLSSSGDVEIAGGRADRQEIDINSSGSYHARRLESKEAYVRSSSSGSATIRVSDYLEARLSSSGDVLYYGNPQVKASESSSGDVERAGN